MLNLKQNCAELPINKLLLANFFDRSVSIGYHIHYIRSQECINQNELNMVVDTPFFFHLRSLKNRGWLLIISTLQSQVCLLKNT